MKFRTRIFFLLLGVAAVTGCGLVDEDMRDCETDYSLDYQLKLVTNMTTELKTQLVLASEMSVQAALQKELQKVFVDNAHDVNLSFYDVEGDSLRLHHEAHVMNANQSSYTLYIPVRKYMHLAAANLEQNPQMSLTGDQKCHTARLHQEVRDTLDSHSAGIFSARKLMDVQEGVDQQFNVGLFMVNCAASLVLDTLGSHIRDVKVYTSGFATDFDMADSTYCFQYTPIIRTREVATPPGDPICFTSVQFPSREPEGTKSILDTDDPFTSEVADHALWQYRVYITLQDGSITETLLGVRVPLKAGQLKVVRGVVNKQGAAEPQGEYKQVVTTTVQMDWNPGLDWEVDL